MITRFLAASAEIPRTGLTRAARSADTLIASRRPPEALPPSLLR
jgi:hypothetical protein